MLKTTKKLTLNKEKLRVLTDTNLERVGGGWINTTGSDWCSSSAYAKCGGNLVSGGCASANCHNP
jgi:hypothetical protein